VWKEPPDSVVFESRDSPRRSFDGHSLFTKWDHLHLLYFMGYAIWNYICAPFYFTWPGFSVREVENPLQDPIGNNWRALEVSFLDDVPAHNNVQKYYFDQRHTLRQLDYRAEVVSGQDAGEITHMCFDHRKF
jgi:hypothetical protein